MQVINKFNYKVKIPVTNECLINSKTIISGFISKIIAEVLNAFFTDYSVKFENKLKRIGIY